MFSFQPFVKNQNQNNDITQKPNNFINNNDNRPVFKNERIQNNFTKTNVFQKGSMIPKGSSASRDSSTSYLVNVNNEDFKFEDAIGGFGIDVSLFGDFQLNQRPLAKFLIYQSPGLTANPIKQDDWDKSNQQTMLNLEAKTTDLTTLYEEFQKMRDQERSVMEEKGLVDKEDTRKTLEDAISFQGSCLEMCPVYERIRRSIENDVRKYEKDNSGKISPHNAIKAFSRPAAGQPPPLPSDVRPPQILNQTLDYIVDNILINLPDAQSFIWDRTRSIRQDFTYQNYFGPEAMDCNETIVRIHILTLHVMAKTKSEFSQQQELEQMNKSLKTLSEMYAEYRSRGIQAPNEAEFRAYYLISQLRDPELEREIQTFPSEVLRDEKVQLVLNVRNMIQTNIVERGFQATEDVLNLYKNFFRNYTQGQIPLLMAYLLEIHLNEIRFYSLKSLKKSLHTKSKPYPSDYVIDLLAFNNFQDLSTFCKYYGIKIIQENGGFFVDVLTLSYSSHLIPDQKPLQQAHFEKFDHKVTSYKEIVKAGISNSNAIEIPKFDQSILPQNQTSIIDKINQTSQSDSNGTKLPGFNFFTSKPSPPIITQPNITESDLKIKEQQENILREESLKKQKDEEKANLLKQKIKEQKLEEQKRIDAEKKKLQELEEQRLRDESLKKQKKLNLINSISSSITKDILANVVRNEVSAVTKPLFDETLARVKKKKLIMDSFSEGLLEAFVGELLYIESLKILADNFRKQQLKKNSVGKVLKVSKECQQKLEAKKRKREEFLEASKDFGIPKVILKRKRLNNNADKSVEKINFDEFNFDAMISNINKAGLDKYEALIYSQKLDSSRCLFLRKKFGINNETNENNVKKDSIEIKFKNTNEINPYSFNNVNLLIFNCDGIDKIREQKSLLRELNNGISLNSNYKFEVLIIFWDLKGTHKLSTNDILRELNFVKSDNVLNVEVVKLDNDMNLELLQNKINNFGKIYGLTAKGEYNLKYNNSKKLLKINNDHEDKISNPSFNNDVINNLKFKESKIKEKHYKHLQKHIEASPKRHHLPKLLSNSNKVTMNVDNNKFNNKLNKKEKIEVYSTPRPKSSELLQTPSYYNDSTGSNISNLSNITFANQSISTPIINKPTYSQVVQNSIKKTNEEEEVIPKSILELRKLAASVRERHGKK
ncbi:Nuclear mRNA export protein SAC3 [Wickerhamomyces ciferrii]|uniref:Nuclear mRNA export factor n=1 Tax=Wickerhamomyces ciferrii (strain ATCC 14091 / BCRC 22168 / CBS 111 / JCM 3599 / NBRC 0793 / NRRL Y-1031 F-60-10) TaxID=1206466 RepID=K0KM17_WICCF|nr:Nuclear mRNA export protein SAC3 [Wickerhamomyces ciferrii]CCH44046.1 Nuclear mRNA export protein SAC3 [Wickerhamomyces ciferrii]